MIDKRKYQEEREQHVSFLNTIIGGFAFTITLTCLQMSNPRMATMVCAPFILGLAIAGFNKFPASIQALRAKAKTDDKARELNDHIYSTDYGKKSLVIHYFPYVYGYAFFVVALIFPELMKDLING